MIENNSSCRILIVWKQLKYEHVILGKTHIRIIMYQHSFHSLFNQRDILKAALPRYKKNLLGEIEI